MPAATYSRTLSNDHAAYREVIRIKLILTVSRLTFHSKTFTALESWAVLDTEDLPGSLTAGQLPFEPLPATGKAAALIR